MLSLQYNKMNVFCLSLFHFFSPSIRNGHQVSLCSPLWGGNQTLIVKKVEDVCSRNSLIHLVSFFLFPYLILETATKHPSAHHIGAGHQTLILDTYNFTSTAGEYNKIRMIREGCVPFHLEKIMNSADFCKFINIKLKSINHFEVLGLVRKTFKTSWSKKGVLRFICRRSA